MVIVAVFRGELSRQACESVRNCCAGHNIHAETLMEDINCLLSALVYGEWWF